MGSHAVAEPDMEIIDRAIACALSEDIGSGDITSLWTVGQEARARAEITVKEDGVIAGMGVAERVFRTVESSMVWEPRIGDGGRVMEGAVVADLFGSTRSILAAERTALNFLQRLSGIATMTAAFVEAVKGTRASISDTRKTTPGLRALEKYAVRVGGGVNHRFGLHDMILIKDNHIAASGGIPEAVRLARESMVSRSGLAIEVETRCLEEVCQALAAGVDRIMFDNMSPGEIREAIKIVRRQAGGKVPETEASGGVTLESVRKIALTGVDLISVGALTHSVKALDIGLDLRPVPTQGGDILDRR